MTSNFNKMALLMNVPIVVRDDDNQTFIFNMPSLRDECDGIANYDLFLGFCASTIQDLQHQTQVEFSNKYDFLIKAIKSGDSNAVSLLACLSRSIQDFKYVDGSIFCGEFPMNSEVFELFCLYISIATGCEKWEALEIRENEKNMSPEEIEWERKKRLNQAKINSTKSKNGKDIKLEKVIACLAHDFHLSLQEIYGMNKFGFYLLYECSMSIAEYEVSQIAAAVGTLGKNSKHTHWINK